MVETVIGCKWSLTVLQLVVLGVNRPGEMERSIEGLSAKVLNDCLRRLVEFNVLDKQSYPEMPPRVEYTLTEFGNKFRKVIDALDDLESDFEGAKAGPRGDKHSAQASTSQNGSLGADDA
ncbi:helix-turn-helix transcriptional regulator [Synechococcus sp. L2F]|uniref:winged helix-turn-helix transcriptional regulator n=1 Tax=Synechococcus sp. L2F TaxID=2823739 RepID=UPI0020CDE78F|nr:helix-turn-helix domain-containing protein [Synechococcus sp. L2F]MCP9828025.1 helix-turn-helix transcriptional regulator [Synechococcus sp. L2F]